MKKTELLAKIAQSRAEFEALLARFTDEQLLQPVLPGNWSPKDALAHVAWWERRGHAVINAVINGRAPEYSLDESDVDNVNRQTYEANRLRTLVDIRREEIEAFRALLALTESLSDDDLDNSTKFAWTKGKPLSVLVEWNTFAHYDEHMPDLRDRLTQHCIAAVKFFTPSQTVI
jgi:hypothetical protein